MSETDQAVVREEFEAVYATFDSESVGENAEAFEALLGAGLESVAPASGQVPQWRSTVLASATEQAGRGVLDPALLEQVRELLEEFRSGQTEAAP